MFKTIDILDSLRGGIAIEAEIVTLMLWKFVLRATREKKDDFKRTSAVVKILNKVS